MKPVNNKVADSNSPRYHHFPYPILVRMRAALTIFAPIAIRMFPITRLGSTFLRQNRYADQTAPPIRAMAPYILKIGVRSRMTPPLDGVGIISLYCSLIAILLENFETSSIGIVWSIIIRAAKLPNKSTGTVNRTHFLENSK